MPSSDVIKEWSAKYMNGTNVLGNGMGYVLKDWNTGQYFKIGEKNADFITNYSIRFSYIVEKGSVIFKSSRLLFLICFHLILTNYIVKYLGKNFCNRSLLMI